MTKIKTWCCDGIKQGWTLTIDSQDIWELFRGKCPYCDKKASWPDTQQPTKPKKKGKR